MCVHLVETYRDEELFVELDEYVEYRDKANASGDHAWADYLQTQVDKLEKEIANRGLIRENVMPAAA